VLVVKKGTPFESLLPGYQERKRRGGTENVPGIVGFGVAARHAETALADAPRMAALRDALEAGLGEAVPGVRVFGAGAPRLPNTACMAFGLLDAEVVLQRLARAGICVSSGSACSSGGTEPSPGAAGHGRGRGRRACGRALLPVCREHTGRDRPRHRNIAGRPDTAAGRSLKCMTRI
jgi:cysteine sulfinate desulfinase/cysteine desulfurase-like protein